MEKILTFIPTIADKVKLRQRGKRTISDAELYKMISKSGLFESKRKPKRKSVSSNAVSSSSATSTFDETSTDDLPSKKPKHNLFINEKKSSATDSEVCRNIPEISGSASPHRSEFPVELNDALIKDIDVDRLIVEYGKEEPETLDPSAVVEFFSHAKELSVVRKRTNGYIDEMMNLAIEMEKQTDPRGISRKETDLINKDSGAVVLSALENSTHARDFQNVTGLKNKIGTKDSAEVQFSRPPFIHVLGSKTHSSYYRNTRENNGVLRQENYAEKVKEKRNDDAIEEGIMTKNENSMCKCDSRSSFLPQNKENANCVSIAKNVMKVSVLLT